MKQSVGKKMVAFNGGLVVLLVVLFSKQLFKFSVKSDNILIQALSITILIMSIILFFYVNYQLLKKNEEPDTYNLDELITSQDYILALSSYRNKHIFLKDINEIIDQIERFMRKQNTLITLLYQNFNNDDNLSSLNEVVNKTERILYSNIKLILNRLSIFDESEYESFEKDPSLKQENKEKYKLMMQHITYVKNLKKQNEILLLEFEKLLMEVSRINASDEPNDLSNIQDFISSMEELHKNKDQEMEELENKYRED